MNPYWIEQSPSRRNCGQIAVAVITGRTVKEIETVINKRGCTSTKDLVKALRHFGYECPDRLNPMLLYPPEVAIAKVVQPGRRSGWHWVAVVNGHVFDGLNEDATLTYITSYLPVNIPTAVS